MMHEGDDANQRPHLVEVGERMSFQVLISSLMLLSLEMHCVAVCSVSVRSAVLGSQEKTVKCMSYTYAPPL